LSRSGGVLVELEEIVESIAIGPGDNLLVLSDFLRHMITYQKHGRKFSLDEFIDALQKKITGEGTLLIPAYNWDYCSTGRYDVVKSGTLLGSLPSRALERIDFRRTFHPIYSFSVWGKNREYLSDLHYKGGFAADSIFGWLHENNAKVLLIDIAMDASLTFIHYVEEQEKRGHRFLKDFAGIYTDSRGETFPFTAELYVRELDWWPDCSRLTPKIKKEVVTRYQYNNSNYDLISSCQMLYKAIAREIEADPDLLYNKLDGKGMRAK